MENCPNSYIASCWTSQNSPPLVTTRVPHVQLDCSSRMEIDKYCFLQLSCLFSSFLDVLCTYLTSCAADMLSGQQTRKTGRKGAKAHKREFGATITLHLRPQFEFELIGLGRAVDWSRNDSTSTVGKFPQFLANNSTLPLAVSPRV